MNGATPSLVLSEKMSGIQHSHRNMLCGTALSCFECEGY